jgi:hypothetical protein
MKCPILKEESTTARCDAIDRLTRGEGVFYCPKCRRQYKVDDGCWDVDIGWCRELNGEKKGINGFFANR